MTLAEKALLDNESKPPIKCKNPRHKLTTDDADILLPVCQDCGEYLDKKPPRYVETGVVEQGQREYLDREPRYIPTEEQKRDWAMGQVALSRKDLDCPVHPGYYIQFCEVCVKEGEHKFKYDPKAHVPSECTVTTGVPCPWDITPEEIERVRKEVREKFPKNMTSKTEGDDDV